MVTLEAYHYIHILITNPSIAKQRI
jgi:hypothetical protein